ncbi:MAG: hypothetical protein K2N82_02500 [Lachnospiraceae bacterium]|nr:hypothetical protein [Lachnospiraceae bacterium]
MRLPGEDEERGTGTPVIYMILAVSVFIVIILAVVFISNHESNNPRRRPNVAASTPTPESERETVEFAEGQKDIEQLYKENKLRAEDLDFWNMYQDNTLIIEEAQPTESPTPTPSHEPTDEELAADGMHTQVTFRDGTTKWVEISKKIPLFTYDLTNLKITNGKMEYFVDGEKNSWLGVDLSKNSGDVDFEALHSNGVDFVMLRLGSRGYETGLLTLDESFENNIAKAQVAGLEVGVTFFSQALDVKEAAEEAEFVIQNLASYKVSYPIAFDMEYIVNDKARIDILSEEQKTQVAEAFLRAVESEGYRGILYGNKSWLLGELVPGKLLKDYDVWLFDASPVPDYPYQFKMWKYAVNQDIPGIENKSSYIISFVDYTRK